MGRIFTVLTGDVVDSTDLAPAELDRAMTALETAARSIAGWRDGLRVGFGRRAGDAWQAALSEPRFGLRAALFLTASFRREGKAFATRIALASGAGDLPADGDSNRAHGPAFVASGRLLETLGTHAHMADADGGARAAATRLADHIAQGWTPAQARTMAEMLPPDPGPRAAVAARLGITRQAVNQALWSAGYPAIADALTLIEDAD